jgi:hypothetical protein
MTSCLNLLAGNLYGLLLVILAIIYIVARLVGVFRQGKSPETSRVQPPAIVRIGEGLVLACAFIVVVIAATFCLP